MVGRRDTRPCQVAMDLGGTNVRLALVHDGRLTESLRFPTLAESGPVELIQRLAWGVGEMLNQAFAMGLSPRVLGVACPGVIDRAERVVRFSPNLTGWRDVPLAVELEGLTGLAVALDNDANLYALGEYRWGAGGGRRDLACYTLGTGVGGGVIVDGRLLVGPLGCGGELGHAPLYPQGRACGCGARGCLEAYASATALKAMLGEALARGDATSLSPGDEPEAMARAAREGDALALSLFARAGQALGRAMAGLVAMTGLDLVVMGGGMAPSWPLMEGAARREMAACLKLVDPASVTIQASELGQAAPLLGAAALAESLMPSCDQSLP